MSESSTKPYLLRAIYEWCTDNGYTPYIAAKVDGATRVPREFVKDGEIVLNISFNATSALKMDNDVIHFNARFGGVARDIVVPVGNVVAIYARENGQGMAFEVEMPQERAMPEPVEESSAPTLVSLKSTDSDAGKAAGSAGHDPEPPKKGGRPTLTRIK